MRTAARAEASPAASNGAWAFAAAVGGMAYLTVDCLRSGLRLRDSRLVLQQLEYVGVQSLSIVNLTAVFTGMVMALQMGHFLESFGAKIFVSRIVSITLLRELAPVLTALMIGGRVGAGITAELGTMAVTEQIDALRALGANPVRKLVVPRLIAVLIMLPTLTILANAIGILGGLIIAVSELGVTADWYMSSLLQTLALGDLMSGLGKTIFFGYFIGIIACYNGLTASGGADGVGRATTTTVVAAAVTVLISDFFLTKLFLML